jgi:flagellin
MNYTLNSLSVALQNMTASESRIRDVDMAAEVIEMTSSQILQQASNAMVGQANVSAQAVLDLLR